MIHPPRSSSVGDGSYMGWGSGVVHSWAYIEGGYEPILVAELTYIGHDDDLYSFV